MIGDLVEIGVWPHSRKILKIKTVFIKKKIKLLGVFDSIVYSLKAQKKSWAVNKS